MVFAPVLVIPEVCWLAGDWLQADELPALSPYRLTCPHAHAQTHTHTRTQISQEQKIKLESFGNTLPQHIDTFGHTQLETHTDTHKKAFSDKKNRYISPCAVSHTQRT